MRGVFNMKLKRENRKLRREESLDTRNCAGYFDLTAFKAVANIRHEAKLSVKEPMKGMK